MEIQEKVTVGMVNSTPKYVNWRGRNYTITKIGLHHFYKKGTTLYHVYSVISETLFMRLKLDTSILSWNLEEISDVV